MHKLSPFPLGEAEAGRARSMVEYLSATTVTNVVLELESNFKALARISALTVVPTPVPVLALDFCVRMD